MQTSTRFILGNSYFNLKSLIKLFKIPWKEALVSFLVGIFIIVVLALFTDVVKVLNLLLNLPTRLSVLVLIFLGLYFITKFALARFLFKSLGFKFSLKQLLIVFGAGELARELPVSLIALTVVLAGRTQNFSVSFFTVGLVQPFLEVFAATLLVAVFGLGKVYYIRFAALFILALMLVLLIFVRYFPLPHFLIPHGEEKGIVGKIRFMAVEIKKGLNTLITWSILAKSFPLAIIYTISLSIVLFWIARSVNVYDFSIFQAISVYSFAFFWAMVSPVPMDLGITESAGFLSLTAVGVPKEEALATMLGFRTIVSGISWLVFGSIIWSSFAEIKSFFNKGKSLTSNT